MAKTRQQVGCIVKMYFVVVLLALFAWVEPASAAQPQAARIDQITPLSARRGETVTLRGIGFGSQKVRVTVAGTQAQVLQATGNRIVFRVPSTAPFGLTQITATNPGGHTGRIGFRVLEGILLSGNPNTLARDATFDLPPIAVDPSQIENGVIMTRLDVFLAHDATVGQVNAALIRVEGGIVSMLAGSGGVTIGVPRQASVQDLAALAQILEGLSGIRFAAPSRESQPSLLFPATDMVAANHLVHPRFPAAWNAKRLLDGCQANRVPVLIPDSFGPEPFGFDVLFPGFPDLTEGVSTLDDHGYHVMAVLATPGERFPTGSANGPATGANPFFDCLDLRPIQVAGLGYFDEQEKLVLSFPPSGKFVVNYSRGYFNTCRDAADQQIVCTPQEVQNDIRFPHAQAYDALRWKEISRSRWADFLVAAAAGNNRDDGLSGVAIYPGLGMAANGWYTNVAAQIDPFFGFAQDDSQWAPSPFFAELGFTSLEASQAEMAALQGEVIQRGLATAVADNVALVGSTNDILSESGFSNSNPDVKAIGEQVSGVCVATPCPGHNGTSFAAPQVAGLASYLWLLSPTLRGLPASVTRQAILANASNDNPAGGVIDAYATVLSLDTAALPNPANAKVRLAILDVNNDGAGNGAFNEIDIEVFLRKYFVVDPGGNITDVQVSPATADFSRFDLNGDGFTGGPGLDRFDLDRVGSVQFGATLYSQVLQNIGGKVVSFDENNLTDLKILCYYAYSALYTGSEQAREALLAGRCTEVTVTVTPAAVTAQPSATQQFAANVQGTTDPRVTWTLPNGGGSITQTGLFTAGNTGGTFTVRAISMADPSAFGEATVTIGGGQALLSVGVQTFQGQISAAGTALDGSQAFIVSAPIGDVGGFVARFSQALAGVTEIGLFGITLAEPVALQLSVGANLGQLGVGAPATACGSTVMLTAGNVRENPALGVGGANGDVQIAGCLSVAMLTVGDVQRDLQVAGINSSVINVTAGKVGRTLGVGQLGEVRSSTVNVRADTIQRLDIRRTFDSTVNVEGSIELVDFVASLVILQNSNLTLSPITGGSLDQFLIQSTTFNAPPVISVGDIVVRSNVVNGGDVVITGNTGLSLNAIAMGNVGRNLTITNNRGFSNSDADSFARSRTVSGAVIISGNLP